MGATPWSLDLKAARLRVQAWSLIKRRAIATARGQTRINSRYIRRILVKAAVSFRHLKSTIDQATAGLTSAYQELKAATKNSYQKRKDFLDGLAEELAKWQKVKKALCELNKLYFSIMNLSEQ